MVFFVLDVLGVLNEYILFLCCMIGLVGFLDSCISVVVYEFDLDLSVLLNSLCFLIIEMILWGVSGMLGCDCMVWNIVL